MEVIVRIGGTINHVVYTPGLHGTTALIHVVIKKWLYKCESSLLIRLVKRICWSISFL